MAMAVCIFLFCTLQTIIAAVTWGLKSANASRLVTRHAVSLVYNLPVTYKAKIKSLPGVKNVASSNWFFGFLGGGQPDYRNFFANFAVDAEEYLAIYPEYILTPEEKRAFLEDRRGCIVGPETAAKFGWKVGDTFQLESVIPPYRVGRPFDFVIRGIYKVDDVRYPGTDGRLMFFNWKYLYESTQERAGVGTFAVEIADPAQAGATSRAIDAMFENSDRQTKTETEAAFRAGFVSLAGNLAMLLNGIGLAVTFTILLVTANTMSMAVRERRTEIAVLKTLGFSSGRVMGLIVAEAVFLGALGGALGIGGSRALMWLLTTLPVIKDMLAGMGLSELNLQPAVAAVGFAVALFLGLAAGIVPAYNAYRSRITDMLRTV
jgi:putative ABC transport system permease protein